MKPVRVPSFLSPSPLSLLIAGLFLSTDSLGQIIADKAAAPGQRPVVLNTANGLPQIDITTPTRAGVSVNRFTQLDIDSQGAIFNNGRTASQTALAGWVAANPALLAQPARVIVGEIRSSVPTVLSGPAEIAGNKADLIIANSAGITCDGCGFLHANRVELATGVPQLKDGALAGYALGQGSLHVTGKGLDGRGAEAVSLISHATRINAGIWARQLELTLPDPQASTPGASMPSPSFALDVAAIGGMYAGRIYLVGSAHGLGVRNAGTIAATEQLTVTLDGKLENSGTLDAARLRLNATQVDNIATGRIYGDTVAISSQRLANAGHPDAAPVIAAATRLDIGTRELENTGHALMFSGGDISIGDSLDEQGRASGQAEIVLNRASRIEAIGKMQIAARELHNQNGDFAAEEVQTVPGTAFFDIRPKGDTERYDVSNFYWQSWSRAGQYRWRTDTADLTDGVLGKTPMPDVHDETCSGEGAAETCTVSRGSNYASDDPAWAYFNLTPPDPAPPAFGLIAPQPPALSLPTEPMPGSDPDGSLHTAWQQQKTAYDDAWHTYRQLQADYDAARLVYEQQQATWAQSTDDRRSALQAAIDVYNTGFDNRVIRSWTQFKGTRSEYESQVVRTDPGQIIAGSDLNLSGETMVNDKSQIIAGGKLGGSLENLSNIDALGTHRIHESGTSQFTKSRWRGGFRRYHQRDWGPVLPFEPADQLTTIVLPVTVAQDNATVPGAALDVGARRFGTDGQSLFMMRPGDGPVFETDPRFTRYRQWLASDVMLAQLQVDPSITQKRIGDGYIEQRLIREQVAQLTGRRFLPGHADDEEQFAALMASGVQQASALQLKPGIALTAEQMAKLTSDLVWLVETEVALPAKEGQPASTIKALAPRIYLKPRAGDLAPNGTLIAARDIDLIVSQTLTNAGTLSAQDRVNLMAGTLVNQGTISGDRVAASSTGDLINQGGQITAAGNLNVAAGRDLLISSTIRSTARESTTRDGRGTASRTQLDRVATLHVGQQGHLQLTAGRDLVTEAARITHEGDGAVALEAGRDIRLGTVTERSAIDSQGKRDNRNFLHESSAIDRGTRIDTERSITLSAGQDVSVRAGSIHSNEGQIGISAARDVEISSGESRQESAQGTHFRHSGTLSSRTMTTRTDAARTEVIASVISGAEVSITSGQDLRISGSEAVSDNHTALSAGRDLTITSATSTVTRSDYQREKQSGFLSGPGLSVGIGQRRTEQDSQQRMTREEASTVGATRGDVQIAAQGQYQQQASQVLAPSGSVSIRAQDVTVTAGSHTSDAQQASRFSQSGMSLTISNPVVDAARTVGELASASKDTRDNRSRIMAATAAALTAENTVTEAAKDPTHGGGITITQTLGTSRSEARSEQHSTTVAPSVVAAAGKVTLEATGRPDATLHVQGSKVVSGGSVALSSEGQLQLEASAATSHQSSSSVSSSNAIGVTASIGKQSSVGVIVSASRGNGHGNGTDLSWTNTQVQADGSVHLQSAGDTQMKGATVDAERVSAVVGGDLTMVSPQDASDYRSRQKSISGSVVIPVAGGSPSAQVNLAKQSIDSTYQSTTEQTAIHAGDGGFEVQVGGAAALTGAAITSSDAAVNAERNRFTSDGLTLSDLDNHAEYTGKSVAVGIGTSPQTSGKYVPAGTSAGIGTAEGEKHSVTRAGISGIAGDKAVRTGDAPTGIDNIFDANAVAKDISGQTLIMQTFTREAPKAVARYADSKINALRAEQEQTSETSRREALEEEISRWREGGSYRVALHATVGGLAGNVAGAAGAGTSAAIVPQIAELIDRADLPAAVKDSLVALSGVATGAIVGGEAGSVAALGQTANNFLTHEEARRRESAKQRLTQCADEVCRAQAREEIRQLDELDQERDALLEQACMKPTSPLCQGMYAVLKDAKQSYADYNARSDIGLSVANERTQVANQEFKYRQRAQHPFAFGVAKGLLKLTPQGLVVGTGVITYQLTTAIMDAGLGETLAAIAQSVTELPAELRSRLRSDDPAVRGEAVVEVVGIVGSSSVFAKKLGSVGTREIREIIKKNEDLLIEKRIYEKNSIEFNSRKDDSDLYFEYKSSDGKWNWPENYGFIKGTEKLVSLKKGVIIDRYGNDSGRFTSSTIEGVDARALAPGSVADGYKRYEVIKEIPNVTAGIAAPAFGKKGEGIQFMLNDSVKWYVENGYLKEIR